MFMWPLGPISALGLNAEATGPLCSMAAATTSTGLWNISLGMYVCMYLQIGKDLFKYLSVYLLIYLSSYQSIFLPDLLDQVQAN